MSKSRIPILALAAAASMIFLPTAASAAPCSETVVPGTNSELDQYVETIPGDCGDTQVGGGGGGGGSGAGGSAGVPLAPDTQAALDALGSDGAAAAALAQQTTPSGSGGDAAGGNDAAGGGGSGGGSGSGPGGGTTGVGETDPQAPSSSDGFSIGSAISGVLSAFGGGSDSGLGVMAPISFAVIALAGAGLLLRRRHLE